MLYFWEVEKSFFDYKLCHKISLARIESWKKFAYPFFGVTEWQVKLLFEMLWCWRYQKMPFQPGYHAGDIVGRFPQKVGVTKLFNQQHAFLSDEHPSNQSWRFEKRGLVASQSTMKTSLLTQLTKAKFLGTQQHLRSDRETWINRCPGLVCTIKSKIAEIWQQMV